MPLKFIFSIGMNLNITVIIVSYGEYVGTPLSFCNRHGLLLQDMGSCRAVKETKDHYTAVVEETLSGAVVKSGRS